MCLQELRVALTAVPELCECVGAAGTDAVLAARGPAAERAALQAAFTSLMTCADATVADATHRLAERLEAEGRGRALDDKEGLVLRLNRQYPRVRVNPHKPAATGACGWPREGPLLPSARRMWGCSPPSS